MNKSFFSLIRSRLIAGIITLLPAVLTIWVIVTVVKIADGVTQPVFKYILGTRIPGAGLILTLIILYLVGGLAQNKLLGKLIYYTEKLINKVPILGKIYYHVRHTIEAFRNNYSADKFERVVYVRYPQKELLALAFVTRDYEVEGKKKLCVFVPTTPNPTSGVLVLVNEKDSIPAKMTIEEAAKFIISGGIASDDHKDTKS